MNQQETLELFAQGKDAWNAWANEMLTKKAELKKVGAWKASWEEGWKPDVGENPETQAWIDTARADFSNLHFGRMNMREAQTGEIDLIADDTANSRNISLVDCEMFSFVGFVFPGEADFSKALFGGKVWFHNATFSRTSWFNSAMFSKDAYFERAMFSEDTSFESATFKENAYFNRATFSKDASFHGTTFNEDAHFGSTMFCGDISFDGVQFGAGASFVSATFNKDVSFDSTIFCGFATFGSAAFGGYAVFDYAKFSGRVFFDSATFSGAISFARTEFSGDVSFTSATFNKDVSFGHTTFNYSVGFSYAIFKSPHASFEAASFGGVASFRAIGVERAFDLGGVRFAVLPDFIQAHFAEAPGLDNLGVITPGKSLGLGLVWRNLRRGHIKPIIRLIKRGAPLLRPGDFTAHFRAMRRLAVQGHDHDNERQFLKGEILSRRFTQDKRWSLSFLFGVGYDWLSDFGGSIARPVYWGAASVAFFAVFYYRLALPGTCGGDLIESCFKALYLSLKNSLLLINWDNDASVGRATACLKEAKDISFWRELALSLIQVVQKMWSATLLFLFVLAVRNRFKIK